MGGCLMSLVSCRGRRLVLLRLVGGMALGRLVGGMGLLVARVCRMLESLVRLVRLMGLVWLVALVGHDALAVHRLGHLLLAVHHGRRLLARRSSPLPRLDDGAGDVALGPASRRVGDIAVDAGLVEEVMGVRRLGRLLRGVGLLLIRRRRVRDGGSLVLGGGVVRLEGGAPSDANLGREGQARMGGGSRLPQGGHDGGGRGEGRAARAGGDMGCDCEAGEPGAGEALRAGKGDKGDNRGWDNANVSF